ncbi:recombination regulator RecX [Caballeronia sp. SEWSISQ10-4 2]|uniref:recombination regulator RecX n=1 Tax=Caballeronia sp. SEWSISQ10-4 2 TaxID=2937438 RepID=UPI00264CF828|nr:recombination regulator RecX [Caballeronia sp. SEWSISQ10-4 2]MDN7178156.1 recombination regulator RecX [Caballeronia sp. SEWSISQ10-4 2]
MMRKSRFGSKAGRDASRDTEQDLKEDPDGSKSISDDDESRDAEEGVDRYERSSDRYRAAAGERAGAEGSAPARRSFGNSFAKSGGGSGGKSEGGGGFKGGGFSSGKSSGSGSGSTSSFARKGSFGRPASSSLSSSGSSKAQAIAASLEVAGETTQSDTEPVFERSSDRAYPKRGSFGGGASARSSSDRASADTPAEYERSSDRSKFGRGGLTGRKAASSALRGKLSPQPAEGDDVFERSTDRKTSRRVSPKSAKPADGKSAESADIAVVPQVDEQRIESVQNNSPAGLEVIDAEERLKRARAVLEQALVQSQAEPAKVARKSQPKPAVISPGIVGDASIDIADPFEPFEQCAPSVAEVVSENQNTESVYSRGSNGRAKTSAAGDSKRKGPQLSLRGRALGYLSRREHSRTELSRKLTPHLGENDSLDTLLDALEREGWLSNERYVESVLHRRGTRLGTNRIVNELKRNGIDETLIQDAGAELNKTELTRAREVWSKKYGEPPTTPAERAKQARFLATRGFTSGTIMKVLKAGDDEFIDE